MIRFPRRLRLGFRPWYGLTLRQLFYLLIAASIAGGVVLTGSGEGADLIVRIVIGLFVILVGVALAFFRLSGLSVEQWLMAKVQFFLHPQRRVWTRGGGRSLHPPEGGLDEAPRPPARGVPAPASRRPAPASIALSNAIEEVFVVLIDMFVLFSLFGLTVYLQKSGLVDIQTWVSSVVSR
jgi:PrgI family protein